MQRVATLRVDPTVREWNTARAVRYKSGGGAGYIFPCKEQWVHGYRNVIRAAALEYDLPADLLVLSFSTRLAVILIGSTTPATLFAAWCLPTHSPTPVCSSR
jgi:hypothetical protein